MVSYVLLYWMDNAGIGAAYLSGSRIRNMIAKARLARAIIVVDVASPTNGAQELASQV
jgi:hypothetical protein